MKFIKAFFVTAFFSAVLYYSTILLCIDAPVKAEYWVAELITAKKELAGQFAGKKKIIVAGGSSTLFGISAEQASAQLNVPVLNFGMHAGMKLDKILQIVSPWAEHGDILVLPLEPGYYDCNDKPNSWQVTNIIGWDHDSWKQMSLLQKSEFITLISPSLAGEMVVAGFQRKFQPEQVANRLTTLDEPLVLAKFRARTDPGKLVYSAYNINNHGDLLNTEGLQYDGPGVAYGGPSHVCEKTASYLIHFVEIMKAKGVQVYFANVPYIASDGSIDAMRRGEWNFRNAMSRIGIVIDRRENLIFERKYFLDGLLHLTNGGRVLRTDLFVKDMSRLLSPTSPVAVDAGRISEYSPFSMLPWMNNAEAAKKPVMWLDACNNKLVSEQWKIQVDKNAGKVELSGWAVDPLENVTADSIFVQVNNEYVKASYGAPRQGVADFFKNGRMLNSGFSVSLDAAKIKDASSLSFIVIANNKTYQYKPVEFLIEWQ